MWLELSFKDVCAAVDSVAREGLSRLREDLPPAASEGYVLIGEHVGESAATWYLSILRSKEGDELAATINIQSENTGTHLTAGVYIETRALFEVETLDTLDHRDASAAVAFIRAFVKGARAAVLHGFDELSASEKT